MAIIKNKTGKQKTDEPLDRNKTELTHNVTSLAMWYLENRGFKPVETEVYIGGFGIVDIAGFCYPTPTETRKLRLNNQNKFGLDETDYSEIQFRYGSLLTACIEVKVTRADFRKDLNTKFTKHPAHLCYLAYVKGILEENELPKGWMGLEMDSGGHGLRRKHWNYPTIHAQHPGDIVHLVASIAIRADYRTRYARHRTMWKMYRAGKI